MKQPTEEILAKVQNPLNAIWYSLSGNVDHGSDFLNDWWHGEWWPEYVKWCETNKEVK